MFIKPSLNIPFLTIFESPLERIGCPVPSGDYNVPPLHNDFLLISKYWQYYFQRQKKIYVYWLDYLLIYYPVYRPLFPEVESRTPSWSCLLGLIALLHSFLSWVKLTSTWRCFKSCLVLSFHLFLGRPHGYLPSTWRSWIFFGHISSLILCRCLNQQRHPHCTTSAML